MSTTNDRRDVTLPVTAEVGEEGGSFADATLQVATFEGTIPGDNTPLREARQPAGDTDAAKGMLRYPTEPPPSRHGASPFERVSWVAAFVGAMTGAAVAFALMSRRR
jgi:hypothetical protein